MCENKIRQILTERYVITMQLDCNEIIKRINDLGIKVDDVIAYKDVCIILGVEQSKATNTRAKHMKDVSQFMKLDKFKRGKFLVVEIYDSMQERDDKRKDNGKQATLGFEGEVLFHMIQCSLLRVNGHHDSTIDDIRCMNLMKQNDLSVQLGLCNELFKPLDDNKHLFTTHKINKLDDCYCHAQTHNVVFYDIYKRQRSQIENMGIVGLERKTLIYENLKTEKDFTYKKRSLEIVPTYYSDDYNNVIDCTYYEMVETTHTSSVEVNDMVYHLATPIEQAIIEDCRNECMDNWNCHNKKKLRVFGEVFSKLNYSERQMFFSQLDDLLHESFDDNYSYNSSVYVYDCTLKSEVEMLQALGCNISIENYEKFIEHWSPFLRHEVNERALNYRFEHIDKKLQEQQDYDSQCQEVRHYGRTRHDKFEYANTCLIHEYELAKVLVRLAFSVDLTLSDYKFVNELLNKNE